MYFDSDSTQNNSRFCQQQKNNKYFSINSRSLLHYSWGNHSDIPIPLKVQESKGKHNKINANSTPRLPISVLYLTSTPF